MIAGLLAMRLAPAVAQPTRGLGAAQRRSTGFRFVARTPPVRAILLLLGVISLTGMPYAVLMPIFADRILHGGARGPSACSMGAAGVGALAGALTLAARAGR